MAVAPARVAHAATPVFINEIHYDDSTGAGDTGEMIEVAGPAGTNLTGWTLVLYNGPAPYDTDALPTSIDDEGSAFGAVVVTYPTNGVQNGAADGIALVDNTGVVVQFLSYEGTINATSGPAAGTSSVDIGVSETNSTAPGSSLHLTGSGVTYEDFTWSATPDDSPGSINAGQTLGTAEPVAPAITDQPDSDTVLEGTSVALTVVATGDEPLTYQWYQVAEPDDLLIDGATAVTYNTPSTLPIGSYGYYVVVSNGVEPDAVSDIATVTVTDTPDPLLLSDPGDQTFVVDRAVTPLTLVASGGVAPYSFSVVPELPAGLTLGAATGEVSGTPTEVSPSAEYTVTVTDSAVAPATADVAFSIAVVDPPPRPFISEFHYDDVSTDSDEFVEVTATAGTDFSQYQIVLYNGNGGASYATFALSGTAADQDDGYGTYTVNIPASPGLQNGAPDGIALVTTGGVLIEFLSYEGVFAAANGPAAGATSSDIGVFEDAVDEGQTLLRQTDGSWSGPSLSNKGLPNGYPGWTPPLVALDPFDPTYVVDGDINPFALAAAGGEGAYTFSVDTLPTGLALDPATGVIAGTPTVAGSYPVTFTVTDSDVPPDADSETFVIVVVDQPTSLTPIADIQGTGSATPLPTGSVVATQGVVTALYEAGGYDGFYIQTGGTGGDTDATPGASDAIFVYGYSSFGSSPDAALLDLGDSVAVVGSVSEFFTTTELTLIDVVELDTPLPGVTPLTLPWTAFDTDVEKEAHEGELLSPLGDFTVTNAYGASGFGEVGLAAGTSPLIQPTEAADPHDAAAINAVVADNAARAVTLDDGGSTNYTSNSHLPLPWYGAEHPPRVSAAVTFTGDVILEYRNNLWKFQPTTPVREATADGTGTVTFEDTRDPQPGDVGGDIRLATFNVLNLFPTTGAEYEAPPLNGSCSSFNDRFGVPITVDDCGSSGPRGAWDAASLARQTAKIVLAINSLDASVVSLEELENSVKFGKNRDFAISYLVDELNAAAGAGTWAYVPSPPAENLPAPSQEDVIRNGFIYKPADVELVGASQVLLDETHFDNAREPLAQAFKVVGADDSEAFVAIVNHFKSKGSSCGAGSDDALQGNCNGDRIGQAQALVAFAEDVSSSVGGSGAVFLLGDFNSYALEDPMQVFYDAGYEVVESTVEPGEASYSFQGLSGSLDHVLGNDVAHEIVTGADIWNINAEEGVMFQYSRYNYNVLPLFDASVPWAASDHNPEVVGLDLAAAPDTTAPIPTVSSPASPTNVGTLTYAVQFSEPVTGFDASDVVVGGTAGITTAIVVPGDADSATVEISVPAGSTGTVTLAIKAEAAVDAAGNTSVAASATTVTVDRLAPGAVVTAVDPVIETGEDAVFTVTFDEVVTGFSADDLEVTGTALSPTITGGGSTYTVTYPSISVATTVSLSVTAGAATDALGNPSTASAGSATVTVVAALSINAFLASTTGSDPEYVELFGTVGHDLTGLSLVVIESDAGAALGTIDKRFDFASGATLGDNGFYLVANQLAADTFGVVPNAVIAADFLENSSFTLALVETASVGAEGTLVDPASVVVVDSIGLTDGGAGDTFFLGAPAFGPDGTFLPPGARRVADGIDTDTPDDWKMLVFSPAGSPANTPTTGTGDVGGGDPDPDPVFAKIHEVQGSGVASLLVGQTVTIEGIVVGDHEGPSGTLRGLVVQEEDADADANPLTSEGVFVFTGTNANAGAVGDLVRVTGVVSEFFGSTQLSEATVTGLSSGNVLPTPATVAFPLAAPNALEHVENSLVRLTDTMVISEYFEYARYGQIVLAKPADGESRPFVPTALYDEDDPAAAQRRDLNLRSRIIVDDGLTSQNPPVLTHPINGQRFGFDNSFRGGDTVTGFTGTLVYSFDEFQMITDGSAPFTSSPAPAAPEDTGGTLSVAALNTLNYFVSLDTADTCGPTADQDCRGADNQAEFDRQRPKLLAAIAGTDADVVGLMEIENTPGVEPLADLTTGLNQLLGEGTFGYIAAGDNAVVGTDAIKVGLLYRADSVTPVGAPAVLDTPEFLDPLNSGQGKNRAAVAQTFVENATGEVFSVVVNHLKSKGSACPGDLHPLAGNCNATRTAAAEILADWLAGDPTGVDDDDWLIIGDLNSYDRESPIAAFEANGYTDLIRAFQGEHAYSYVFDGEFGYLDHILGSASIAAQITGSTEWHINSTEASVWDYDTEFKPGCPAGVEPPCQVDLYEPFGPLRSSDHDAAIVGLALDSVGPAPTVSYSGPDPVATESFTVTVQFSEDAVGFDDVATDVLVTGPAGVAATAISGGGSAYTVTVNVPVGTSGSVSISVPAGAAADATGHPSIASNTVAVGIARPAPAVFDVDGFLGAGKVLAASGVLTGDVACGARVEFTVGGRTISGQPTSRLVGRTCTSTLTSGGGSLVLLRDQVTGEWAVAASFKSPPNYAASTTVSLEVGGSTGSETLRLRKLLGVWFLA